MPKITARIVADSISPSGQRITTVETEFHRWILAEFNTHRQLSKNASSSRAIPVERVMSMVHDDPAEPVQWGSNNAGMQSNGELSTANVEGARVLWRLAARTMHGIVGGLQVFGLHKQWANRLIENFTFVKHVSTATEWANFFHLRRDLAAQPEIRELADRIYEAMQRSQPVLLQPGDWHMPYYDDGVWIKGESEHSLDDALKISTSCCAQVSYRRHDDSLEKAESLFSRLMGGRIKHASPTEHQATPMETPFYTDHLVLGAAFPFGDWANGVTHLDRSLHFWSGNFKGWVQHRQLITGHDCKHYSPEASL